MVLSAVDGELRVRVAGDRLVDDVGRRRHGLLRVGAVDVDRRDRRERHRAGHLDQAGTEVTVAAVISDTKAQRKLVIADTRLVPAMAALDASLMTGLPKHVTAATGMDALTHAVEAFLGQWTTPHSDRMALACVGLVYANLRTAVRNGRNLVAREQMALAATYGGLAFTRASATRTMRRARAGGKRLTSAIGR